MAGFVATPTNTVASTLSNDGWWPDVDTDKVREAAKLDGNVTSERLQGACIEAMASVNDELASYQATQRAAGFADAAAVLGPQLAGESVLLHRYRRAIVAQVRADLLERYRNFDTTNAAEKKAVDLSCAIDDARRDLRWAIRDITGRARTTVELI